MSREHGGVIEAVPPKEQQITEEDRELAAAINRHPAGRALASRPRWAVIRGGLAAVALLGGVALTTPTPTATAIPYCDGTQSPCYCPDDGSWNINAFTACPGALNDPSVPHTDGDGGGRSIWDRR